MFFNSCNRWTNLTLPWLMIITNLKWETHCIWNILPRTWYILHTQSILEKKMWVADHSLLRHAFIKKSFLFYMLFLTTFWVYYFLYGFSLGCMINIYVHVTFYVRNQKWWKENWKKLGKNFDRFIFTQIVKNSSVDKNIDNHFWITIDSFYQSNWIT